MAEERKLPAPWDKLLEDAMLIYTKDGPLTPEEFVARKKYWVRYRSMNPTNPVQCDDAFATFEEAGEYWAKTYSQDAFIETPDGRRLNPWDHFAHLKD